MRRSPSTSPKTFAVSKPARLASGLAPLLSALVLSALTLSGCSDSAPDASQPTLGELIAETRRAMYDDCLAGDLAVCEDLRDKRSGGPALFDDGLDDDYLVFLRDAYAQGCRDGEDDPCTALSRLLSQEFGVDGTPLPINDGDRLWWRACLLEQMHDRPQNACHIVFGHGEYAHFYPPDYAERLRADHLAGGQEGLLARVTDGAVRGAVPGVDPGRVSYVPPQDAPQGAAQGRGD